MDLTLDEEYAALRETVADFARTAVAPVIGDLYERGKFPYDLVIVSNKGHTEIPTGGTFELIS